MPTDGNVLISSNRARSISPAPFVVSHDTFIKNTGKSQPTDLVAVQKKKDVEDEKKDITDKWGKSVSQSLFTIEPPTPKNVKNRGPLNETEIIDFPGKEDASERMDDRNAKSRSEDLHGEDETLEFHKRFPDQEAKHLDEQKLKRRASKKLNAPKSIKKKENTKRSETLQILPSDGDTIMDLEVLKQSRNLTKKELIVMTEVLNSRKSRSRSSSRMERDILPRDANKNESTLNKSDTNDAVKSERTHENNLPEIAMSSNKVISDILKENVLHEKIFSVDIEITTKKHQDNKQLKQGTHDAQNENENDNKHRTQGKQNKQEQQMERAQQDKQDKKENQVKLKKETKTVKQEKHEMQEKQNNQANQEKTEKQKTQEQEEKQERQKKQEHQYMQEKKEKRVHQEQKESKDKKVIFDPFEHIENIADLTVENLKDHLLREEIDIEALSELSGMNNELKTFPEVPPVTKAREVKTKPNVRIDVHESSNIFQTPDFERKESMQTKGKKYEPKATKIKEKQMLVTQENTTYPNIETNIGNEYLSQAGHLGEQPSKENKLTLKGKEKSLRPSGVFFWLLLVFALLVLYLVVQKEFKEVDTITSPVLSSAPVNTDRAKRSEKDVISENLYDYFDVKKWP